MSAASGNAGGLMAGMGAGMGMAMAGQMAQAGPWGVAPAQAAPPPPPPPVEKVWHIAEKGKINGPFSRAELGRMADEGKLKRDTHVWSVGLDGWKTAAEVVELAQLFTILPPPPPEV